jgi:hypothetical protein
MESAAISKASNEPANSEYIAWGSSKANALLDHCSYAAQNKEDGRAKNRVTAP